MFVTLSLAFLLEDVALSWLVVSGCGFVLPARLFSISTRFRIAFGDRSSRTHAASSLRSPPSSVADICVPFSGSTAPLALRCRVLHVHIPIDRIRCDHSCFYQPHEWRCSRYEARYRAEGPPRCWSGVGEQRRVKTQFAQNAHFVAPRGHAEYQRGWRRERC